MGIHLIVTDLDGTFYHSDLTYDKKRFMKLYAKMKEKDIHFVIASGNQYYQLISFFEDIRSELTFVSENGAYIVDHDQEIYSVSIKQETYHKIINVLKAFPDLLTIICGKKSAYVLDTVSQENYDFFTKYFPVMQRVHDYDEIDDQILKFSLVANKVQFQDIVKKLNEVVDDTLSVVTCGNECIDLIVKGVHKGHALRMLMNKWNITADEVLAFGDAENDYEMLKIAKYGYVMENGSDYMKEQFPLHAPNHEQDGVLTIIEKFIGDTH